MFRLNTEKINIYKFEMNSKIKELKVQGVFVEIGYMANSEIFNVKKNEKMPQGGIVEIPRPMNVSKLNFVCPKCAKVTRIGFKIEKNLPAGRQGKKFRICKKCDSKI